MKSLPKEGDLSTEGSKPKREAVLQIIELEVTKSTPAQIMLPSTPDAGCGFGFGLSHALIPSFLAVLPLLSFIMGMLTTCHCLLEVCNFLIVRGS